MKKSESIEHIAKALCKFQTEVQDAPKDSQAYNYKYADLGTILHLVRPVMQANGLAITQFPISDGERIGVTTILTHTSGEWMENEITIPLAPSNKMSPAQQGGSTLTYLRRYSVAAVLGITQVDDDAVMEQPGKPVEEKKPAPKKAKPATDDEFAKINEFVAEGQIPAPTLEWLKNEDNWNNLTSSQAKKVLTVCRKFKKEN